MAFFAFTKLNCNHSNSLYFCEDELVIVFLMRYIINIIIDKKIVAPPAPTSFVAAPAPPSLIVAKTVLTTTIIKNILVQDQVDDRDSLTMLICLSS